MPRARPSAAGLGALALVQLTFRLLFLGRSSWKREEQISTKRSLSLVVFNATVFRSRNSPAKNSTKANFRVRCVSQLCTMTTSMGLGDDENAEPPSAPRRRRFWWTHQVGVNNITHLDVFYGSRTGTARELASEIASRAAKRGVVVSLQEMNEFDPTHFDEDEQDSYFSPSRGSVFVISTHYAGPPPNAETFIEWLRTATDTKGPTAEPIVSAQIANPAAQMTNVVPGTTTRSNRVSPMSSPTGAALRPSFSHSSHSSFQLNWRHLFRNKRKSLFARLQYAVFGVGNSTYLTYNAMGKLVDARLHSFGAVRLGPLGLGDVSNNINATFSKWEAQLLQHLSPYSAELGNSVPAVTAAAKKVVPRPLISANSAAQLTTPRRFSSSSGPTVMAHSQAQQRRGSILRRSSSAVSRTTGRNDASMREHFDIHPVTPLTLTVLDLNGRPVRLRFRCRFLTNERSEEAKKDNSSYFLPENNFSYSGIAGRTGSENATQSWFTLKSLNSFHSPGAPETQRMALLRLSIEDFEMTFEASDSFGFFPPNAPDIVDNIARHLGFDLNAYIEVLVHNKDPTVPSTTLSQPADEMLPFPRVCTARTVLRNFLELRTVSREFVRLASGFVTTQKEHELLETLSSTDGAAAFRRHFTQEKGGVLKLLELAPSLRIPFEVLINITPMIKPRFHLIASSPRQNSREFDIVVPLGELDDTDGLVVSNWQYLLTRPESYQHLKDINIFTPATPLLRGFFSGTGFSTPSDRSAPMLMIAEGFGVVPCRALLQHRQLEEVDIFTSRVFRKSPPQSSGKNLLLLGCSIHSSLMFESELFDLQTKGVIELRIAFHDDADYPQELVQHLVHQHWEQINALMASSVEARLFVCGNAAMVREVHDLVALHCKQSKNEWYELATQSGRYVESVIP
ncbi:unnamed protein product [Phytophthora lilii]|uniref:NADPH--hemoprotein reductase n=1 Tax=Phytophthora lilii TaxID=2077276 RepID=A0A9W6XGV2_9STRA|nr:unnamed protein product [Phytophthora lilii]